MQTGQVSTRDETGQLNMYRQHSGHAISPQVAQGVHVDTHSTMSGRQARTDSDFSMDHFGDHPGIVLS